MNPTSLKQEAVEDELFTSRESVAAARGLHGAELELQLTPRRDPAGCDRVYRKRAPRALLYSHDTYGLGHLRRNLAIAEHLLQRPARFDVMLLSGSPVVQSWPLPPRLQISVMPPVVKVGAEQYVSRDGSLTLEEIREQREAIIIRTILDYRPDVFLVDHAPAGMKGELLSALALLRAEFPATRTILGLRDILDDGATVRALWEEQGTYELIRQSYDHVLVYGTPALFDVVKEYGIPSDIAAKLRYCGHVARRTTGSRRNRPATRKSVLVTVGGGGDGYPAIHAYLRALDLVTVVPAQSTIVSGPLMPAEQHEILESLASRRPGVYVTRSTTEMARLLAEVDLVVTMAGYNSTVEVLAARMPAILVPRAAPRAEQRLRAELLANLGLVWVVRPDEDAVVKLAELLDLALSGVRPAGLDRGLIELCGAERVGDVMNSLVWPETARWLAGVNATYGY